MFDWHEKRFAILAAAIYGSVIYWLIASDPRSSNKAHDPIEHSAASGVEPVAQPPSMPR